MNAAIAWMAKNIVAANLLMLLLMVGGLIYGSSVQQEIFPEIELDVVTVAVAYPGAGPSEVETGVCLPVEEAIFAIQGIDEMRCLANEGAGVVTAEIVTGSEPEEVLQDIKAEVDRIRTFPEEAEDPIVSQAIARRAVLSLALFADIEERALREIAERVRDDLLDFPEITQVSLGGVRPYEISIEIPEAKLQKYSLTLEEVAQRIRAASVDVPGGTVKTRGGEILLRTKERRYVGSEYESIGIVTLADGTTVTLADLGEVRDSFQETDQSAQFNGKRAAMIEIFRVGDQRPLDIAEIVHGYIAKKKLELPDSVSLQVWNDRSELLKSRLSLLMKNAYVGLILVIVILGLFLEIRLAFWVTLGIPISFLGALFLLPGFDVSINMISLFAFILSLGIVVDDAIIVGENIYEHRQRGKSRLQAAIDGAQEVSSAVIFSVLTSVAAFLPMLFVSGMMGKFMRVIPVIVISTLLISLVESLFILPAHLAHSGKRELKGGVFGKLGGVVKACERILSKIIEGPYRRSLLASMHNRWLTISVSLALLIVSFGFVSGGILKLVHMPSVDAVVVRASITMPVGTPIGQTSLVQEEVLAQAVNVARSLGAASSEEAALASKGMYSSLGSIATRSSPSSQSSSAGSHLASVSVLLPAADDRDFSSHDFAASWRNKVGELPGVESLTYRASLIHMGDAIDIQLEHQDFDVLAAAALRLRERLREFQGVGDISDSLADGKRELKLELRPEARTLGVSELELGRQIRSAFYGSEALRIQRGREELRVMVRYPRDERESLANVDSFRVRTPDGSEVPFAQVAEVAEGVGYSQIKRSKRKRVVNVTASVDESVSNAKEIIALLRADLVPVLMSDYPGLSYVIEGQERERSDSMSSLYRGFAFVLLLVYALLAIPFKSYLQPLIVMAAIPFGFVGAAFGHLLLDKPISILSMCGLIALSGVVVNDSLIMVDFINRTRKNGEEVFAAVAKGGCRRFRPILLTSLTTFFGLTPIIFETSLQAQFLIPMAISLGFGVLIATGITLYLIPSLYLIVEDFKAFLERLLPPTEEQKAAA